LCQGLAKAALTLRLALASVKFSSLSHLFTCQNFRCAPFSGVPAVVARIKALQRHLQETKYKN